jgi:hypothetical protein
MTLLGMDTEAGLAAADEIDAGSRQVAELARRLDNALHGFDWVGPDADESRETWDRAARPTLDTTAAHLAALAVTLRREAQAQEVVSQDGGSASAAGATTLGAAGATGFFSGLGKAVTDRLAAVFTGVVRTLGHAGGLVAKIGDVLTGREDWSVAEVAASAIATAGSGVGTVVNAVTGEDERWFGEGPGVAGTPVAAGGDHPLVPPTSLSTVMAGVTSGYAVGHEPGSTGDVRVTTVTHPGAAPTYIVAVPGTDRWGPDATGVLRDLSANVALVADEPTAAAESVRQAMAAAGVPDGAQVLLVGHSQGGIVTGQLAADPAFAQRYQLSMLTYGAPIDHMQLQPGVHALQVQHTGDVVPTLDLGGYGAGWEAHPNTEVPGVVLPGPGGGPGGNHDYQAYAASVEHAMAAGTPEGQRLQAFQDSLGAFLVTPGGTATAVDVPVRRGP